MTLDEFKGRRQPKDQREYWVLARRGTLEPYRPLHLGIVLVIVAYGIVMLTSVYACTRVLEVVIP
jgi:hypothetical protein